LPVKINILLLMDRPGSSPVKRSINLRLIRDLPLILGMWLKQLCPTYMAYWAKNHVAILTRAAH